MLDYQIIPARVADRPAGAGCWCLVLHGLGDSMEGWKPVAQLLGIDSLGYVFANAPDDYHGGYSWFDLSQDFIPDPGQIRRSRAALEELIGRLLGELGIPSAQLFLMGFSQGSLMCVDVALRSSHRFAGVIGISGFMALLEEFPAAFSSAGRQVELLLTHGLFDPLIPIAFARRQRDQLRALGVTLDWREYPKEHTLDRTREVGDIRAFIAAHGAVAPPPRR